MKRRAKLEDIVWIAERGERWIVPERQHDWFMLCLKNAHSRISVEIMSEFLNILRMSSKENMTASEIHEFIDLKKYKWMGGEWLAVQCARFLPNGEKFVKDLVEEFKIDLSVQTKQTIKEEIEKNKSLPSQKNKQTR